ncbi:MAG: hypothetical protein Q9173_005535 [Seirophora scorigena]
MNTMATPHTPEIHVSKTPLGFLDLPPEIRIQIYPHLLSASHLRRSTRQGLSSSGQQHHPPRYPLRITYAGDLPYPAQIYHQPPRYYGCTDKAISPAILATCRQIWLEASPFLYGAPHTFSILQDCGTPTSAVVDVRLQLMKTSLSSSLSRWCRPDDDDDENWAGAAPDILQRSPLAAFVRKIGAGNAALVADLELRSADARAAGNDVALAAELCGTHMPGLRTLRLCLYNVTGGGRANRWSRCRHGGALGPVYAALAGFVKRVWWLKELRFEYLGELDLGERETRGKIRELEKEVQERAGNRGGAVVVDDDDEGVASAAAVVAPPVLTQAEMLRICAEWDEEDSE